jgi:hypothetical protein
VHNSVAVCSFGRLASFPLLPIDVTHPNAFEGYTVGADTHSSFLGPREVHFETRVDFSSMVLRKPIASLG